MCVRNTNQLNRTNGNSNRSSRVKVKYFCSKWIVLQPCIHVSHTHWEANNKLIRKNKVYQLKSTGKWFCFSELLLDATIKLLNLILKKREFIEFGFSICYEFFFQDEYYIKTEHKVSGKRSFSIKAFVWKTTNGNIPLAVRILLLR